MLCHIRRGKRRPIVPPGPRNSRENPSDAPAGIPPLFTLRRRNTPARTKSPTIDQAKWWENQSVSCKSPTGNSPESRLVTLTVTDKLE